MAITGNGKEQPKPTSRQSDRHSDEEGTVYGEGSLKLETGSDAPERSHLKVQVEAHGKDASKDIMSPSQTRERAHRLEDDLAMLQVEQQVSQQDEERVSNQSGIMRRSRSRRDDPVDDFDIATNPLHEKAAAYRPPENPSTKAAKFFKRVHESIFIVRWFTYIVPVVCILLIPLMLGALVFKDASVGGVRLMWFSVWLEIVWLTLWAGRVSIRIRYEHEALRLQTV
jgi:hypothetical protein